MFVSSTIGRKIVMALTGQVLVLFILFHISGNSAIFSHRLNAYVAGLDALAWLVWPGRLVLGLAFLLHAIFGALLKFEDNAARPQAYLMRRFRQATTAGRYQFWTGVAIAAFVVYHLLQFSFQVTDPSLAADTHPDALGRPDVFMMVVQSFRHVLITAIYTVALACLGLHLMHGIQSSFQTWGLTSEAALPVIVKTGNAAAVLLFFWYAAIPISIAIGLLGP